MKFQELKSIVGVANVRITSEMRYSELRSLVEKASIAEQGLLTIVVKNGTLSDAEILGLATLGRSYVQFDLTD